MKKLLRKSAIWTLTLVLAIGCSVEAFSAESSGDSNDVVIEYRGDNLDGCDIDKSEIDGKVLAVFEVKQKKQGLTRGLSLLLQT